MTYTRNQLSRMADAAQYIADENRALSSLSQAQLGVWNTPTNVYARLSDRSIDVPIRINPQKERIYGWVFTENLGGGGAAGFYTPITAFTRTFEFVPGETLKIITIPLSGTATEGTFFTVTLNQIQPPQLVVPAYANMHIQVNFTNLRSQAIPSGYVQTFVTDFTTSYTDFQVRGYNATTGNPAMRAILNRNRWQFNQDDVLFMMNNEIPFGQTNPCEATPWMTAVDPVTGTGTVRCCRTEWVPNAANGGIGLVVQDDFGNNSATQTQFPWLVNTHRSGLQASMQNLLHFRYGYIEVDCYQAYTNGTWPAPLWLLPAINDGGDTWSEIDIGENQIGGWIASNTQATSATHYQHYAVNYGFDTLNLAARGITLSSNNLYNRWIRYGCNWSADSIDFYIDGQLVAQSGNNGAYDWMFPLLMHRSFNGPTGPNQGPAWHSDMYVRKLELWQSPVASDKHYIWKNEPAPTARSGYRFDSTPLATTISLTGAGMIATVTSDILESTSTHNEVTVVRTVGTCATNEKKYAAFGAPKTTPAVGVVPAGGQQNMMWPPNAVYPSGIIYRANGQVMVRNSTLIGTIATFVAGDLVEMAIDRANDRIWFRVTPALTGTPGNWNNSGTANPATNVGGISIAGQFAAGVLLFGCILLRTGAVAAGDAGTLNTGTPPSGFTTF